MDASEVEDIAVVVDGPHQFLFPPMGEVGKGLLDELELKHAISVKPLHHVAVNGGTHGNEMSGVYLVNHWLRDSSELVRETFAAVPLLANPKATEKRVRYTEMDLNRCFTMDILTSPELQDDPYEVKRAREINSVFGPRGSKSAFDMILDLHNTTSNMGTCLILSDAHKHLEMHACHYIQDHLPNYNPRIYLYTEPGAKQYDLCSVSKYGIGTKFPAFEVDVYQRVGCVDFPRSSDGAISAVVHPSLQDQDFSPLHPGDPTFLGLDGKTIPYNGQQPIYPVFINEAAYYEKKIAFIVTEKIHVSVPDLCKTSGQGLPK